MAMGRWDCPNEQEGKAMSVGTIINRASERFRLFFIKLIGTTLFRLRELCLHLFPLRLDFDIVSCRWNGGVLNIFRGLDAMAENLEFSLRCVDALSSKALSLITEVTIENYY